MPFSQACGLTYSKASKYWFNGSYWDTTVNFCRCSIQRNFGYTQRSKVFVQRINHTDAKSIALLSFIKRGKLSCSTAFLERN